MLKYHVVCNFLRCASFCKYGIKESVAGKEKQEEQIIMQSAKDVRDLLRETGCILYTG